MNLIKLLWSFYGRIGRLTYFGGIMLNLASTAAVFVALYFLEPSVPEWVLGLIALTVLPFSIWISLALAAKRFHDTGASGWFGLLLFIPLVGIVVGFYLLFARGEDRDNQYGPAQANGSRSSAVSPA
jgi:uncharacterized membrane protein YhaH (DUF805 family)